jgi:serine/threonine protein kinase
VSDHRADLFAVGVMLVEALTGCRPFGAEGLVRRVPADPLHLPGLSPAIGVVEGLLRSCLAPKPEDRCASAAALRNELIPALRSADG